MIGSTWRKIALLVGCLAATPLALAQEIPARLTTETTPFVALMAALGMLFVVAIVATGSYFQQRQTRERLSLIERLSPRSPTTNSAWACGCGCHRDAAGSQRGAGHSLAPRAWAAR